MYVIRRFAVRHSRAIEAFYLAFERIIVALDPVFSKVGYNRLERPVAAAEKAIKSVLFDCQMCGQCVLSSTGMSCPMNCPKTLRNGPCGGVRAGGFCEVKPQMKCVWVDAWEGAARMRTGLERIVVLQPPVDKALAGSSSWLRVAREKAASRRERNESTLAGKLTVARAFSRARKTEPASAPIAEEPAHALADHAVAETTSNYARAHHDNTLKREGASQ